ncbi:MAG TPA: enoyl-CoA hydratase/isomerase family protein [Aliidongia sp.]|uniref:enoyl-CoA hydratase/isomerase family protein n=1 Tax=Aliidongia sp. TaxID=1914230 RepID=UPI002DDCAD88|nr:enoyl-CoA hydratase/isomerase family protein [Aliidongia sp.]HEV2677234.1 enoyl-CoA hydratase/isomerase family protein [Aliidongia sp.]
MTNSALEPIPDEVLVETRGRLGIVTLNRPKALNALSLGMIRATDRALIAFAGDEAVDAVVIRGAGEKAFCAGGDVRALVTAPEGVDKARLARDFFAEEYRLNLRIHDYPKPFVALIDGVTMGGGCGLSLHSRHVVATERTMVAMPETVLGLFPDVGATWFLNRCPGEIGLCLGLTGRRLKAADLKAIGLASHVVPSPGIDALVGALAGKPQLDHETVRRVLDTHGQDAGPSALLGDRVAIDRIFAGDSLEAIIAALSAETAPWAAEALHTIQRASPTSLRVTFRQLRQGRALGPDVAAMLRIEYRLAVRSVGGSDFPEGVRAILVDKDNKPAWRPARLDQVDAAWVEQFFAPFQNPADELTFP